MTLPVDRSGSEPELLVAMDRWNDLVQSDKNLDHEAILHLQQELQRRNVEFGGRPLCTVLRPNFILPRHLHLLSLVCSALATAIRKIRKAVLDEKSLSWMELGDFSPREQELITLDPGFRHLGVTARFDAFLQGQTLHFVELNSEAPAGIAYNDMLLQFFQELPAFQRFSADYWLRPFPVRDRLLGALLRTWKAWGGQHKPRITIVDWKDLPTATEFQLFRDYFRERGFESSIADPRELQFLNGRLLHEGLPVDLVYRRVLVQDCVDRPLDVAPLVRAVREHSVCMVNSFRIALLHRKALFALLTDPHRDFGFSDDERRVIRNHVPWTRRLSATNTSGINGEKVDLLAYVQSNKDRMVLKPNNDYGGHGIVLGWQQNTQEWEQALAKAALNDYVVQERVRVTVGPYPILEPGLPVRDLVVDMDPFLFRGDLGGFLTRLSVDQLANVTAGGGQVPTFLLQAR